MIQLIKPGNLEGNLGEYWDFFFFNVYIHTGGWKNLLNNNNNNNNVVVVDGL